MNSMKPKTTCQCMIVSSLLWKNTSARAGLLIRYYSLFTVDIMIIQYQLALFDLHHYARTDCTLLLSSLPMSNIGLFGGITYFLEPSRCACRIQAIHHNSPPTAMSRSNTPTTFWEMERDVLQGSFFCWGDSSQHLSNQFTTQPIANLA